MDTAQRRIDLGQLSPEIRSYVHQLLLDLEVFCTETTTITVYAKDPMMIVSDDPDWTPEKLKKMWRICFKISEDGSEVSEEAVHEDLMTALRVARDKLLATLTEIQDQVVSPQDRLQQIRQATSGGQVH